MGRIAIRDAQGVHVRILPDATKTRIAASPGPWSDMSAERVGRCGLYQPEIRGWYQHWLLVEMFWDALGLCIPHCFSISFRED